MTTYLLRYHPRLFKQVVVDVTSHRIALKRERIIFKMRMGLHNIAELPQCPVAISFPSFYVAQVPARLCGMPARSRGI